MNLFKKATATLAIVTLLSWIFSTGVNAYSDAELKAANTLAAAGIIVDHSGNPAGYNLDQNVLRQEIAAVARGIAGIDKKTTCAGTFNDVSATRPNDWACYTVEALADNGLIALNTNFNPEQNITKAEAIGMMVKAAFGDEYTYNANLSTTWQQQVVAFAVSKGVTSNFVNYDTPATRGFVFLAGANAMEAGSTTGNDDDIKQIMCELLGICDDETNPDENNGDDNETPIVVTGGGLEVTLNPKTPAAMTIPKTGLIPFGKIDFTAGKEDVEINSITLKREGLSNRTDIRRAYFEKNGIRVSNRSNVGIDELVTITFTPAFVVTAGSTQTLDLIVELSGSADVGAEHRFAILSEEDIDASAKVGGTYPVRTNLMRVGSYEVKTVEIQEVSWDVTYNVGQEDALLSEFKVITTGEKDNLFKSVTLRNAWDADVGSSVENLALYNDGTKVSTEFAIDGRDLTIYVNDTITNGRSENYQLRWNITWAERTRETYQFEVRNSSDLTVVEVDSGFSAPVVIPDLNASGKSKWGIVTVEGGDFLVSRDTSFTLNQTVSAATTDVVLWAAKTTVAEDVNLEDVTVTFSTTSASLYNFSTLKFLVGDATVSTYTPTALDTNVIKFESNFTVRKGNSTMRVTWNLKNNVTPVNATFKIDTMKIGSTDARYVANDERVDVKGSATGILTTVADGDINLVRNDGIDSSRLVAWMSDKEVFGFQLRANDVSDVKVTWLTATAAMTWMTLSDVSNMRLYQDGTLVSTRNNFDFNNLDITLKKNTASSFKIVVDFSSSIGTWAAFQLTINPTGVNARNVDSNRTIQPSAAVKSEAFVFGSEGQALVTVNSSQPSKTIVTPSNTSETPVMKFDIEAKDDNMRVTDIYVTSDGASSLAALQATLAAAEADLATKTTAEQTASGLVATTTWALQSAEQTASGKITSIVAGLNPTDYTDVTTSALSADLEGQAQYYGAIELRNLVRAWFTANKAKFTDDAAGVAALLETIGTGATANASWITGAPVPMIDSASLADVVSAKAAYDAAVADYATKKSAYDAAVTARDTAQTAVNNWSYAGLDMTSAIRDSHLVMSDGRSVKGTVIATDKIWFSFGTEGIIVKKDNKITWEVRVAFYDSSNRTNEAFTMAIMNGTQASNEVSGTVNGMRVVSESTGIEVTRDGWDVTSNTHLLARSKPTVSMASGFVQTSNDLYRFTITADANREITVTEIDLNVANAGAPAASKISIYKGSESASNLVGTVTLTAQLWNGSATVNQLFNATSVNAGTWNWSNLVISKWTTETYLVKIEDANYPSMNMDREVKINSIQYQDDVSTPTPIPTADYGVGVPTQVSSYKIDTRP